MTIGLDIFEYDLADPKFLNLVHVREVLLNSAIDLQCMSPTRKGSLKPTLGRRQRVGLQYVGTAQATTLLCIKVRVSLGVGINARFSKAATKR